MAKVIIKGLAPPDHPIYKEGWSIAVNSPGKPPAKKEKKPQCKK